MTGFTLNLIMFGSLILIMCLGVPLAWSLLIVSLGSGYYLLGGTSLDILMTSVYESMSNFLLLAIPLFILMGMILKESGITDKLFDASYIFFRRIPGGLGVTVILICALIAAMVGVSGAATVSLGIIALPAMLERGYDAKLSTGSIMAGGALGFLIPPSVVMIVYAFLSKVSVGKLFIAGIGPGILLALIYIIYIIIRCSINPTLGPRDTENIKYSVADYVELLRFLIGPIALIVAVLGAIMFGVASPSEAAGVGVVGSLLLAASNNNLKLDKIKPAFMETIKLTGMIMWIAISAVFFSKIYTIGGGSAIINEAISNAAAPGWLIISIMLLSYIIMGMFLDDLAITFITIPIYAPIVVGLGYDPIWFAILFILSMQTAYLSPPFGYNLFYMRSVAPSSISTLDIYKSALPFIGMQIIGIVIVFLFPSIATFLPEMIFD